MTRVRRELLIADTTFVSAWRTASARPGAPSIWPEQAARRIRAASLSVSVVTVGELRAGHLKARWGARRRSEAERGLSALEQHAVDRSVAEAWATLKEATRRRGAACSDNDLWIGATGVARGVPVVTCDRDFLAMRSAGVEVIYLPRQLGARTSGTD